MKKSNLINCYVKCSCGHGYEVVAEPPIENHVTYCIQCGKENIVKYVSEKTVKISNKLK